MVSGRMRAETSVCDVRSAMGALCKRGMLARCSKAASQHVTGSRTPVRCSQLSTHLTRIVLNVEVRVIALVDREAL